MGILFEFGAAISMSERISYFGLSANLIMYLTRVIHQDLKTATNNVNYWKGATTLLPLIGGYVGDAYTGRFRMALFCSLLYLKVYIYIYIHLSFSHFLYCTYDFTHFTQHTNYIIYSSACAEDIVAMEKKPHYLLCKARD